MLQCPPLSLMRDTAPRETIERFWCDCSHREASSWAAHRDINRVMLATSLAPDGYRIR